MIHQENKKNFAELNDIKYGLLSVDRWKQQISIILSDEINKLSLSDTNEIELKKHIEVQLNTLLNNVDKKIKASNADSASGWVKQTFINLFVSLEDIKKGIPQYADAIMKGMTKEKTQDEIKEVIKERLDEYLSKTFDTQDTKAIKRILMASGSSDLKSANAKLQTKIAEKRLLISRETLALIVLMVMLFSMRAFSKKELLPAQYILLVAALLILLITGVTTPMIDMEAKISEMSFVLLDHTVQFKNQVLYFQTKSILDVFWIMIMDKAIEMKMVGILMIIFSIVFPVFKLISSVIYFYDYRELSKNKFIQFFVLKSGKWSMADVLTVAIFMAYIGFNGIITSQFGQLNSNTQELVVLTTNGTALQPGFYLFFTYAVLALFLSGFLTKKR